MIHSANANIVNKIAKATLTSTIHPLFGELKPKVLRSERSQAQGLAFECAAASSRRRGQPLSGFVALTLKALEVNQMRVYVKTAHEYVGYVIWTMLTPDGGSQYIAGGPRPLADWECGDGTSAWLLDFAVATGSLRQVMVDPRDEVFNGQAQLTCWGFKGRHRLCKCISRTDNTSFMTIGRRTTG